MDTIAQNQTNALQQWAHDVRSPLLSLEVLSKTLSGIPAEHKSLVNIAVERIRNMTQEILQSSKNSVVIQPPETKDTSASLATIIDRVVSLKWLEVSTRPGIELTVRLGQNTRQAKARISSLKLERILSNLINNSIEAIFEEGQVAINLIVTGDEALILIEDNGSGMSERTLQLVQDQQCISVGKTHGYGIGLWSARRQIEQSGGSLGVESLEGYGTSVMIRLPILTAK